MTVALKPVTVDNWQECIDLKVKDEQADFAQQPLLYRRGTVLPASRAAGHLQRARPDGGFRDVWRRCKERKVEDIPLRE
jgi:hypothetical protein